MLLDIWFYCSSCNLQYHHDQPSRRLRVHVVANDSQHHTAWSYIVHWVGQLQLPWAKRRVTKNNSSTVLLDNWFLQYHQPSLLSEEYAANACQCMQHLITCRQGSWRLAPQCPAFRLVFGVPQTATKWLRELLLYAPNTQHLRMWATHGCITQTIHVWNRMHNKYC